MVVFLETLHFSEDVEPGGCKCSVRVGGEELTFWDFRLLVQELSK